MTRCTTKNLTQAEYNTNIALFNQWSQRLELAPQRQLRTAYRIPCVVHVVGTEQFMDSISDARIVDNIRQTNLDFNRQNQNFGDVPEFFQNIAIRPNLFNIFLQEIRRHDPVNLGDPSDNDVESELKLEIAPSVDPDNTCNIWLVGDQFSSLGYAYYPSAAAGQWFDGLVVRASTVASEDNPIPFSINGRTFNWAGRTITHEMGHYLGLEHTWGRGSSVSNTCTNTYDQPFQRGANDFYSTDYNPVYPLLDCDQFVYNDPDLGAIDYNSHGEMFYNYMDYSDDQTMSMFSIMQQRFMDFSIETFRNGMTYSNHTIIDIPLYQANKGFTINNANLKSSDINDSIGLPAFITNDNLGNLIELYIKPDTSCGSNYIYTCRVTPGDPLSAAIPDVTLCLSDLVGLHDDSEIKCILSRNGHLYYFIQHHKDSISPTGSEIYRYNLYRANIGSANNLSLIASDLSVIRRINNANRDITNNWSNTCFIDENYIIIGVPNTNTLFKIDYGVL